MGNRDHAEPSPDGTLFVPEDEVRHYRSLFSNPIIGVPPDVKGITRTRNWILDNAGEPWVVMVDDDVKIQGYWIRDSHSTKKAGLSEVQWLHSWARLFEMAEDMNLTLWGVETSGMGGSDYSYRPFIFHTYVTASCCGIRNTGARFDESFPVKEDYEFCLRMLRDEKAVIGCRFLHWVNSHWSDPGGCSAYRTDPMEIEQTERLLTMYPGLVRRIRRKNSPHCIRLL